MVLKFSFWPGAMAGGLCIPAMAAYVPSWLFPAAGLTSQVSLQSTCSFLNLTPPLPSQAAAAACSTAALLTTVQENCTMTDFTPCPTWAKL